ncbi:MAG: prepilin-type N-terminal cleavage/methylation domain-containing protein [Sedimentisphaerales bacterium]|nr:prepilin-type N-terminal cleavage/methylation domain-containing protein [Sedimentisphaerales bacterium]
MGKVLGRKFKLAAAGFTLVELLVVVAIVLIIVSGIVTVGGTVRTQAKIRNTESTIRLLESALTEYNNYKSSFPPGCGDEQYDFVTIVQDRTGYFGEEGDHAIAPDTWGTFAGVDLNRLLAARASVEILYFFLDQVPDCQKYLSRIAEEYKTNEDGDSLKVNDVFVPLIEVNDAWQRPIRYKVFLTGEDFPELISAGPDGLFYTADDIISTEMQL